jgi:hypothetical protein
MSFLKAALGFVATAYMNDAVLRPRTAGQLARDYCNRVGKPLLLIRGERMADVLLGDPVQADRVTRMAYPVRVPDKTFGAVVVINVMERLRRPGVALEEWRRVADKVFVVLPSWWAPHAWLDPGNRWLVHPDMTKAAPLWTDRRSIYLLPVSDSRYGTRRWTPKSSPRRSSRRPNRPPPPSPPLPHEPSGHPRSPMSPPTEATALPPGLYVEESPAELPDLYDLMPPDHSASSLGTGPSYSPSSPSVLTVVSTEASGDA